MKALESEEIKQKYYSITEVAEKYRVTASLIRFWETEFDILRPKKNKRGYRQFSESDLQNFSLVHHLVKEKGYTIQGARELIRKNRGQALEKMELSKKLVEVKNFLTELKRNLS